MLPLTKTSRTNSPIHPHRSGSVLFNSFWKNQPMSYISGNIVFYVEFPSHSDRRTQVSPHLCESNVLVISKRIAWLCRCFWMSDRLEDVHISVSHNNYRLFKVFYVQYNQFLVWNCLTIRNFESSTERASARLVFAKIRFHHKSALLVCSSHVHKRNLS